MYMKILGVHLGHDSSACFIDKGKVLFAEEEERITGEKNYFGYPHEVINHIESEYLKDKGRFDSIAIGWNIGELLIGRKRLKCFETKTNRNWISTKIDNALEIENHAAYLRRKYPARDIKYPHACLPLNPNSSAHR